MTVTVLIIAAISGIVSTLAGIFTRRAYKKVTHLEAQVGQYPPVVPDEPQPL